MTIADILTRASGPSRAEEARRDLEPGIAAMLDRKAARQGDGAYLPRKADEIAGALRGFFAQHVPGAVVADVARMGGGASKEQFVFRLEQAGDRDGRYVLRMDPRDGAVETDRRREYEVLRAMAGTVPVPPAVWLAADGEILGQPASIMAFTGGVTKPSDSAGRLSGLGTFLAPRWRDGLGRQFIDNLVAIHGFDWRSAALPSFGAPDADPRQAARWQANWWTRVWHDDRLEPLPIMAAAEAWMRDNLPEARELVLVHADYRTGNYLFDEASGQVTAILDWELAHIGDHHEDLAWVVAKLFGAFDEGQFLASGLMTREAFLDRYAEASGRTVDLRTLHFYEVLTAVKCIDICFASGSRAALEARNHQDVLLSFLASAGHVFQAALCELLEKDVRG
jgi:aminoglycoside phosphotransferase (APT) family kinase protein